MVKQAHWLDTGELASAFAARQLPPVDLLRSLLTRHPARILLGASPPMADTRPMDRIVTLPERKAAEAVRRRRAVTELRRVLDAYARAHGGRFLLFGSAARGEMRYDSDVDILVEFPSDRQVAAWNFAERACWDRRLDPDITTSAWCTDDFLAAVRTAAEVPWCPGDR